MSSTEFRRISRILILSRSKKYYFKLSNKGSCRNGLIKVKYIGVNTLQTKHFSVPGFPLKKMKITYSLFVTTVFWLLIFGNLSTQLSILLLSVVNVLYISPPPPKKKTSRLHQDKNINNCTFFALLFSVVFPFYGNWCTCSRNRGKSYRKVMKSSKKLYLLFVLDTTVVG